MSYLSALAGGGIVSGVGKVLDDLFTSDKERTEGEVELRKLALEEAKLADAGDARQVAVNLQEAKHSSVFVAGWRPFVGWTAGIGLAVIVVVWPLATLAVELAGMDMPPLPLDPEIVLAVLSGLLGIGKLGRSYEKAKGVARASMGAGRP